MLRIEMRESINWTTHWHYPHRLVATVRQKLPQGPYHQYSLLRWQLDNSRQGRLVLDVG